MKAKKILALIIVLLIGSMASAQDILPRKAAHDDKTKDTADVEYIPTQPFYVPELGYQIASEFMWQDFEDALRGRPRCDNRIRVRNTNYKIHYYLRDVYRISTGGHVFLHVFDDIYYRQNKKAFIRDRKGILTFIQKDYRRELQKLGAFQADDAYQLTYEYQMKMYNQLCKMFLGNGAKDIQRTKSVQRGGKSRSTRQGRRK